MSNLSFITRSLRAGQDPHQWKHKALVPPISLSTTFRQTEPNVHAGFEYSRISNPSRQCLEENIASWEGAKYALCFASGLATMTSLTFLLESGDHVVCFDDLFGGTNVHFRECLPRLNIDTSFVDFRNISNLEKAIKPETKMVWFEGSTNPNLKIVDMESVSKLLQHYPQIISVVDNTFMTPYFQKPLDYGIHIVMESLTKYMNGHTDVVMGAIATNRQDLYIKMKDLQHTLGTVPSPFDCFLVNRGLKTFQLRMDRHAENAAMVAQFLSKHEAVEKVNYLGLKSHPDHELAKRQCSGYGGMVSFYVKGDLESAQLFIKSLRIISLAQSLGSVESLVGISAIMSHGVLPEEDRKKLGITENLIRLSVGLESVEDIIEDLDQALLKSQKV